MRKIAKRTDRAIIIALVIIAVLIFISVKTQNDSPGTLPDSVWLESYNGKPMGVMPGSPSEAVTSEHFPESRIIYYTGIPELYTALITGKIDGFVMSEITLRQMARENPNVSWLPDVLNTRYRYFGFAKTAKGEQLCAQMNEILAEFNADGTMAELENIWYGDDETRKVLDDSGLTGKNGTLYVGVSSMDEPYNYVKETSSPVLIPIS